MTFKDEPWYQASQKAKAELRGETTQSTPSSSPTLISTYSVEEISSKLQSGEAKTVTESKMILDVERQVREQGGDPQSVGYTWRGEKTPLTPRGSILTATTQAGMVTSTEPGAGYGWKRVTDISESVRAAELFSAQGKYIPATGALYKREYRGQTEYMIIPYPFESYEEYRRVVEAERRAEAGMRDPKARAAAAVYAVASDPLGAARQAGAGLGLTGGGMPGESQRQSYAYLKEKMIEIHLKDRFEGTKKAMISWALLTAPGILEALPLSTTIAKVPYGPTLITGAGVGMVAGGTAGVIKASQSLNTGDVKTFLTKAQPLAEIAAVGASLAYFGVKAGGLKPTIEDKPILTAFRSKVEMAGTRGTDYSYYESKIGKDVIKLTGTSTFIEIEKGRTIGVTILVPLEGKAGPAVFLSKSISLEGTVFPVWQRGILITEDFKVMSVGTKGVIEKITDTTYTTRGVSVSFGVPTKTVIMGLTDIKIKAPIEALPGSSYGLDTTRGVSESFGVPTKTVIKADPIPLTMTVSAPLTMTLSAGAAGFASQPVQKQVSLVIPALGLGVSSRIDTKREPVLLTAAGVETRQLQKHKPISATSIGALSGALMTIPVMETTKTIKQAQPLTQTTKLRAAASTFTVSKPQIPTRTTTTKAPILGLVTAAPKIFHTHTPRRAPRSVRPGVPMGIETRRMPQPDLVSIGESVSRYGRATTPRGLGIELKLSERVGRAGVFARQPTLEIIKGGPRRNKTGLPKLDLDLDIRL